VSGASGAASAGLTARERVKKRRVKATEELVRRPAPPLCRRRRGGAARRVKATLVREGFSCCQQRECTVGTWVGATVGRGRGAPHVGSYGAFTR
jgi:hypothetical protein